VDNTAIGEIDIKKYGTGIVQLQYLTSTRILVKLLWVAQDSHGRYTGVLPSLKISAPDTALYEQKGGKTTTTFKNVL
jgi:hypothetical protein